MIDSDCTGNGKGCITLSEMQITQDYEMFGSGTVFGPLNRYLGQRGYLQSLVSLHRPSHFIV